MKDFTAIYQSTHLLGGTPYQVTDRLTVQAESVEDAMDQCHRKDIEVIFLFDGDLTPAYQMWEKPKAKVG